MLLAVRVEQRLGEIPINLEDLEETLLVARTALAAVVALVVTQVLGATGALIHHPELLGPVAAVAAVVVTILMVAAVEAAALVCLVKASMEMAEAAVVLVDLLEVVALTAQVKAPAALMAAAVVEQEEVQTPMPALAALSA